VCLRTSSGVRQLASRARERIATASTIGLDRRVIKTAELLVVTLGMLELLVVTLGMLVERARRPEQRRR
jgi:hypothetical protein